MATGITGGIIIGLITIGRVTTAPTIDPIIDPIIDPTIGLTIGGTTIDGTTKQLLVAFATIDFAFPMQNQCCSDAGASRFERTA